MVDDGRVKDVAGDGVPLLLDLMFGAVALRVLRAEVLVLARQAGLPDERAGKWSWPCTSWQLM